MAVAIQPQQNERFLVQEEWLHEGRIVVLTLRSSTRTAIDEFVQIIERIRDTWDTSQPLYAVYDMSHDSVIFTPYARQRMEKLASDTPPQFFGAYAVVTSNRAISALIAIFMKFTRHKQPRFEQASYSTREQAVRWLAEKL